jgi:hypothetical protein
MKKPFSEKGRFEMLLFRLLYKFDPAEKIGDFIVGRFGRIRTMHAVFLQTQTEIFPDGSGFS